MYYVLVAYILGFPGGSEGKSSACNAGDLGSIPGSGRSPGQSKTLALGQETSPGTMEPVCSCVCIAPSLHSCPTLCDPMDCSPPGSSVHGILQARMLEWVAIPFSRGSFQPRDQTQISCIADGYFTV